MQLRNVTKRLTCAITAAAGLLNVPEVAHPLVKAVAAHPHLSSLVAGLLLVASLLHNPQVIQILGLKTEEVVKTSEVVPLASAQNPPQQ